MSCRRLVGIDLGIATAHTVRVLDGEGTIVAKRKAWPTKESLTAVETAALADRKGQSMSKAGSSLLRTTLVRAAGNARRQDPQLARIYYQQMTQRGKDHLGALCVVAASLAERAWTVMRRGTPYVICDTDGRPVTAAAAKAIIAEHWTVPAEVRARRRGKKTGKAPHKVLEGQYARGSLPRATTPPQRERSVKPST